MYVAAQCGITARETEVLGAAGQRQERAPTYAGSSA